MGAPPKLLMRHGDVCEVSIDGIGTALLQIDWLRSDTL